MGSILRSTPRLYSLVGGSSRLASSLIGRRKITLFKKCRVFKFYESRIRNATVSAQKEDIKEENHTDLEKHFFQLSEYLNRKNVPREHFKEVLETLKEKGEIKPSFLIVLLKCCSDVSFTWSQKDRLRMAKSVWTIATDFGFQFNIEHYNALLKIFVVNHHKFSPAEFLDSLKKVDLVPNFETYRLLLQAYCLQGDIEGAKLLLNKMKELGYQLRRQDFNSLIQGHCAIGDLEKAAEVLKIMEEKKCQPFADTYVHLLCGYAKFGKINEIEENLNELPGQGIFFLDSHLLEIFWTLAINNYIENVDMILERLSKTESHHKIRYVFRLFDKKMDALALKLLGTIARREYSSYGREILYFFIAYRKPNEILDISNRLEEIGFVENPLGFILKKIFLTKNENFCIRLLEAMKARNMTIKKHYYWPAIIKASKKGNSELFTILKRTSNKYLLGDHESLWNVILPNYKLNENWKQDLVSFIEAGVKTNLMSKYFLQKFLEQNKLDEVEYLVKFPVETYKIGPILNNLYKLMESHPSDLERIVNILYIIAHNCYTDAIMRKSKAEKPQEYYVVKLTKIFDRIVQILLKHPCSEEVKQRILETMLEKKMCISSEVSSLIKNEFTNPILGELIEKLEYPNVKFEICDNIVKGVLRKSNLELLLEPYTKMSVENCVKDMLNLAKKNLFEEAIKVGENMLVSDKELKINSKAKELYKTFLFEFVRQNKDLNILEKAFDLGVKLGVNTTSKFYLTIMLYLRINTSMAVEKFCEYVLCFGRLTGCFKLLSTLISQGDTEAIKRLTDFLSIMYSKNLSTTYLILALYENGEEEGVKEILKTQEFEFDYSVLNYTCSSWFKKYNCDFFERALKMFKHVNNFNRQSLYEKLAEKYVNEYRIDDLNKLWLEIQKDNDLSDKFVQQMADFVKNPEKDFWRTTNTMPRTQQKHKDIMDLLNNGDFDTVLNESLQGKLSNRVVLTCLDSLASEGKVSQVLELIKKLRLEKYIQRASAKFLSAGKMDEYFEFVNDIANQGNIARISECFKVGFFQPPLTTSDEHLEKYKSLAIRCLEGGNFVMPLVAYFVACVKIPGKLAKAEEVFHQYINDLKQVPHSYLCKIAEARESASDFYENLLTSEKLKAHFSEQLHEFYNRIISIKCNENKFDFAASFLQKAVEDGVDERLDKNLITLLNEKIKENGKSIFFPKNKTSD